MKRIFKTVTLSLLATTAMFAVSCGGNASKKQTADTATATEAKTTAKSGSVALKDVSADNWQAAIKSNFGVDVAVPQGWAFKSVESPSRVSNLNLMLTTGEGTTGKDECRRLFEATKTLSPHGNYKNNANWEAETVSAGDAINDFSNLEGIYPDGDVITNWAFTFDSKMIMVSFTARKNFAIYTFVINKTITK